ncbi:MAG: phosphoribosylformylglycinamidine synthase subunit PurQ [Alphaproteobacteria bacterium]|jgi:phosphoribosylformylglycinamidine synthase I|nr:phosphoribosylformylglycinamidine synthase subunit PurQ [Alphaproteobacteria bacterium]
MKAAVIVSPGSNCDRDVQVALRQSAGADPIMHWHGDPDLPYVDLIVVPGGFSYGDYLRAGAMAAHSPVIREVVARANKGVPVLGICNGFQILTECGLLPGVLMRNAGLKFICRDVDLRVEAADTVFTRAYVNGQIIRIPVAHNEGNYFADEDTLNRLDGDNRVAFRYCTPDGEVIARANPNGASRNIAGILNEARNVLGMMPHPERLADAALGGTDGRPMFDSLVEALAAAA